MVWEDKAKVNSVLLFCKTWKSREEIAKEFKLTEIESWHCVRWIGKLSDISVQKKVGLTGRAYLYRTRQFAMDKFLEKLKLEEEAQKIEKKLVNSEEGKAKEEAEIKAKEEAEIKAKEEAEKKCEKCGQIDKGQTGEYPCEKCGLPTVHDEPEELQIKSPEEANKIKPPEVITKITQG